MNALLVALGGAVGSLLRYWLSGIVATKAGAALWGTLFVNITGSFLIGLLAVVAGANLPLRNLLLTGLLGGFTTFSAFSLQTLELFENGNTTLALANIALSIILCLLGVWLGSIAGRAIS
jgi:fluoride exporter